MTITDPYEEGELSTSSSNNAASLTSPQRLATLRSSAQLDGVANPVLDRLTRLVTRLLKVPVSLVSLVDDRGQHFPGLTGLGGWAGEGRGTPLSHSFCQHVVMRDAKLVVEDASMNPLVMHNLALKDLGVVAYAGVPLRASNGETLGALCAINSSPMNWSDDQIATLEDLALAAMAEIELRATTRALIAAHERLRAQAHHDALTGLLNRHGFSEQARQVVALAERSRSPLLVVTLDLDGFKEINDTFGHDAGDQALVEMATILKQTCRASDLVGRLGGDEFVLLCPGTAADERKVVRNRIETALEQASHARRSEYVLAASIGFASWQPADSSSPTTLATLLRDADAELYCAKRARKLLALATAA